MLETLDRALEAFTSRCLPDPVAETARLKRILEAGITPGNNPALLTDGLDVDRLADARASGIPLEYAVGCASFLGRLFRADSRALIPREETELLARTAIAVANEMGVENLTVLDIGTGLGNLAITLAHEVPSSMVYASDITEDAVELARQNVEAHGLTDRVTVLKGSLYQAFDGLGLEGETDIIVCNPPYIPTASLEKLAPEIRDHEPREAFDGGGLGIDVFRGLIDGSVLFLRRGGLLAFEIGAGQGRLVNRVLTRKDHLTGIKAHTDPDGVERVFSARRA
jgi:release factor glutamine methyltransferase